MPRCDVYAHSTIARLLGLPVLGRFGRRGPGWERAAALFDEVSFEVESDH